MRLFPLTAAVILLSPGCAASAADQSRRPDQASTRPTADRNLYSRGGAVTTSETKVADPQAFTRNLFSRFDERIVDVEERHSGPGAFIVGVNLYERPEAHHIAGMCRVRVHYVTVNTAPPPANPPRYAESVHSSIRYFAVGPVNSSIPPQDQRQRCAALPSARNFFTASDGDAQTGLQALTDARYFVTNMPRAISFTCKSYFGPCEDPSRIFMRYLTPDRVSSIERIPCADGKADVNKPCLRISFGALAEGFPGGWTVTSQGLGRPVRLHLEQAPHPVS